ncbi:MAG: iron-containing alcohol dehydrogenase [Rhodobacteraceae bacterium]|nr:iron-containing alcohol dehydrogenase [Paracoccaceae bacterium]
MNPFTFNTPGSIVFGAGKLADLGVLATGRMSGPVLLITDPGLVETGIAVRATNMLAAAGLSVSVFPDVMADPPESVVQAATDAARAAGATGVVGVGGGSSLDVAKLVAVLATGQEKLADMYGVGNTQGPRLPLILVPTTAGTGAEVTMVSIVTTGTSEKIGVVSPWLLPDVALLDPELTYGLPSHITAATGIDAMVHAIEAYASASPNNNPLSRALACEALRCLGAAVETAVHDGGNQAARADMLLGSMLAGQAFANSPVAAVHALAYPIGGYFKVPHGLSNALVLPHVLRFNCVTHPGAYAELAPITFPELEGIKGQEAAAAFVDELARLSQHCGLQQHLRDVGIREDDIPMMARAAMNQTRLLQNNPRQMDETAARSIYRAAF